MFEDYDFDRLQLLKNRGSSYSVYETKNGERRKIIFTLENVVIPFGVEKYNYKEIINLEIKNSKKDNIQLNNISAIRNLEKYFKDRPEFGSKFFKSTIRNNYGYDPLIRTHLKKSGKNTTTNVKNGSLHNLKNTVADITIELSSIWTTTDSYGITLVASDIDVKSMS